MKNIAVITGAAGGLGREFVKLMLQEHVDEIWCIARSADKLEKLFDEFGEKIIVMPLDLSLPKSLDTLAQTLKASGALLRYLVNNAGVGELFTPSQNFTTAQIANLVNVNCTAVAAICVMCIPYMNNSSIILNIASQSSFQPVPYINLYAASKAFVRSYSRALNAELKASGITVTAVCPGWIDTDMLVRELNGVKIDYPHMVKSAPVAQKALQDAKKGKDMSVYGSYVKYMHLLAKLFPQKTVMKTWLSSVKKYL